MLLFCLQEYFAESIQRYICTFHHYLPNLCCYSVCKNLLLKVFRGTFVHSIITYQTYAVILSARIFCRKYSEVHLYIPSLLTKRMLLFCLQEYFAESIQRYICTFHHYLPNLCCYTAINIKKEIFQTRSFAMPNLRSNSLRQQGL